MNTRTSVQCNSLVTLPRGFNFYGLNATTWWLFNRMYFNGVGLQLSNASIIGQQGGPNNPSDNIWESNWTGRNGTWTQAGTSLPMALYQGGGRNYYFPNNRGTPANYSCSSNLPAGNGCNGCNARQGEEIALDTNALDDPSAEINQFILYINLAADDSLLNVSDTLNDFFSYFADGNVGTLNCIEAALSGGDFATAQSLLAEFEPESNVQQRYFDFYSLYYSYYTSNSLSNADSILLQTLCYQCPDADGLIVYNARVLWSLIYKQIINYDDNNCNGTGYSRVANTEITSPSTEQLDLQEQKQIKRDKTSFAKLQSIIVYPNPANDRIYITSKTAIRILRIEIVDVAGRKIQEEILASENQKQEVKLHLQNGVYFLYIISDKGVKTKKLVVCK